MRQPAFQYVGTIVRWAVGLLFIYMGLSKALQPVEFLKLVRQYDLVQVPWMLNTIAAILPWFEVFCGVLLTVGVAVRGAALVTIGMLIPFTTMVVFRAVQLAHAGDIPFCMVKFNCGCGAGEVFICNKIIENTLLLLGAGWLLGGYGKPYAVLYKLFRRRRSSGS